ncbi:hypothetical protein [Nocardia amamiensis]|uniref:hypothetical protein n=1 Tax=Nocardia amamiensis TaxID=404578 RepID=UPI00082D316E|nr:hypothetical protein [Nocardia amamiensis]
MTVVSLLVARKRRASVTEAPVIRGRLLAMFFHFDVRVEEVEYVGADAHSLVSVRPALCEASGPRCSPSTLREVVARVLGVAAGRNACPILPGAISGPRTVRGPQDDGARPRISCHPAPMTR